jgi:hypothetical protein
MTAPGAQVNISGSDAPPQRALLSVIQSERNWGLTPEENPHELSASFFYKAFGLTISSCLPCPELLPGAGAPDVAVVYGHVPDALPGAVNHGVRFQTAPGQLLLQVNEIGNFLVRDGRQIVIDRHPTACDDDVRVFLLGSAVGALLHQRGTLILHGSSVKVDDGCVVLVGRSGVGKSTLATALRRRGYPCLGDDICPISIEEDGIPYAAPAYPQAKLWTDALHHFGIDTAGLRRVRPQLEKRALPIEGDWQEERVPVKRIYVLSPGWGKLDPILQPITGTRKLRVLRDYTYRVEYLRGLDMMKGHFRQVVHLASRLPVTRVVRPVGEYLVEQLADALEQDFRS